MERTRERLEGEMRMNSEKIKKALRIAVNVGCGFEADAEYAAELLSLITGLESRIAELSQAVGLITTLKPTMVMDTEHPLDMVREVAEHVTARIAELEAEKCVLIDQQREVKNILIDKKLHIDSLYEEGYKLQQRITELEAERDQAKAIVSRLRDFLFDYTQFHISTNPEERWWALVDKFDELVKERER